MHRIGRRAFDGDELAPANGGDESRVSNAPPVVEHEDQDEGLQPKRPAGDEVRDWGPPFHEEDAAYFVGINRNKRSIGLDLASDGGRDVLIYKPN